MSFVLGSIIEDLVYNQKPLFWLFSIRLSKIFEEHLKICVIYSLNSLVLFMGEEMNLILDVGKLQG